jgi:hypothetical protein
MYERVHDLVGRLYLDPLSDDAQVYIINHINSNSEDNSHQNLEWKTRKENTRLASGKSVCALHVESGNIYHWPTVVDELKELNISNALYYNCMKEGRVTAGRYLLIYDDANMKKKKIVTMRIKNK